MKCQVTGGQVVASTSTSSHHAALGASRIEAWSNQLQTSNHASPACVFKTSCSSVPCPLLVSSMLVTTQKQHILLIIAQTCSDLQQFALLQFSRVSVSCFLPLCSCAFVDDIICWCTACTFLLVAGKPAGSREAVVMKESNLVFL